MICLPHDFYPRSPCGERPLCCRRCSAWRQFLSTLSLRRATFSVMLMASKWPNFYPRSPCGERLGLGTLAVQCFTISIHALLAESDVPGVCVLGITTNFYPRSPCGERRVAGGHRQLVGIISIHALLAESDRACPGLQSL